MIWDITVSAAGPAEYPCYPQVVKYLMTTAVEALLEQILQEIFSFDSLLFLFLLSSVPLNA